MCHLNKYSNTSIVTYLAVYIVMQIGSQSSIIEGLVSIPIILLIVVWSESITDSLEESTYFYHKLIYCPFINLPWVPT